MMICMMCRFPVELDDVALRSLTSRLVCLRCFGQVTGTSLPMPHHLRCLLEAALAQVEEAA